MSQGLSENKFICLESNIKVSSNLILSKEYKINKIENKAIILVDIQFNTKIFLIKLSDYYRYFLNKFFKKKKIIYANLIRILKKKNLMMILCERL